MLKKLAVCLVVPTLFLIGCEKSTVEGPSGKKLTLVKPADPSVKRGSTEKLAIVVSRANFEGPVTIAFENLPKGVQVVDDGGKVEGNERTFVLTAAPDADLVEKHTANVTAKGPDGMAATEQFKITVVAKS